jgi:hypothetical protein
MSCTVYHQTVLISRCKACPLQGRCKRGRDIATTFPKVPAGSPPEFANVLPPLADAIREGIMPGPKGRIAPGPATDPNPRGNPGKLRADPKGSGEVRKMERMPQLDKDGEGGAGALKHALFYIVPAGANIGVVKTAKELKRWLGQRMEGSDPVRLIRGKELAINIEVKTRITLSSLRQKKKGK